MSLIREHLYFYDHIFRMPGFLADPVLVFGRHPLTPSPPHAQMRNIVEFWWKRYQPKGGVWLHNVPVSAEMRQPDLNTALRMYGVSRVINLDYFDEGADLIHDMNEPIAHEHYGAYGTLIDIGSIEHVFDTRQCLENMFRMVRVGGHLLIHTPCAGYFNHGLHLFSPECLVQACEVNGFNLKWVTYTTPTGLELDSPQWFRDAILWLVAEKTRDLSTFICPQQGRWKTLYRPQNHREQ